MNKSQIIELNLRAHPNKQKLIRKRRLAERQACPARLQIAAVARLNLRLFFLIPRWFLPF